MLKAACLILRNLKWAIRLSVGSIETESGMAHSGRSLQESIDYIESVFHDYKRYGQIENFAGKVAEIGPGDNAGVALLMRSEGCTGVDLIDRYTSRWDHQQQASIYESLSLGHDLDAFRIGNSWDSRALRGIKWRNGESAENYFKSSAENGSQRYDFIVSRAVFEHLQNPIAVLRDMVKCLRPGGCLLHKVDLRDHGMFSSKHHELTWLGIPTWMWRRMTSHSGLPNRRLVNRYRDALEELKMAASVDYSLLVTQLVQIGDITPHKAFDEIPDDVRRTAVAFVESKRHEFASEFRSVDARDLAVSGVFLILRKQ